MSAGGGRRRTSHDRDDRLDRTTVRVEEATGLVTVRRGRITVVANLSDAARPITEPGEVVLSSEEPEPATDGAPAASMLPAMAVTVLRR